MRHQDQILIQIQENNMTYSKNYLLTAFLLGFSLMNWGCDDRIPEETTSTSNATITITEKQAISDIDPINVGEVVSGFSKMRIVATLANGSNQAIKDGIITFSCDQAGSFDVISPTTDVDGEVFVIFDPDDAVEAVDKLSTVGEDQFEGAT
ncbi:MAG TPA: hypothetical protein EYO16_01270, partial [Candidatus Marinimicrobia bacterium]|nr:hypothetical protein [Candidatus Neomarinimicrobiota bacterium]